MSGPLVQRPRDLLSRRVTHSEGANRYFLSGIPCHKKNALTVLYSSASFLTATRNLDRTDPSPRTTGSNRRHFSLFRDESTYHRAPLEHFSLDADADEKRASI